MYYIRCQRTRVTISHRSNSQYLKYTAANNTLYRPLATHINDILQIVWRHERKMSTSHNTEYTKCQYTSIRHNQINGLDAVIDVAHEMHRNVDGYRISHLTANGYTSHTNTLSLCRNKL